MVLYLRPIDELELPLDASQFLKSNNVYFIQDLIQRTRVELLAIPGATAHTVLEVDLGLRKHGYLLRAKPYGLQLPNA